MINGTVLGGIEKSFAATGGVFVADGRRMTQTRSRGPLPPSVVMILTPSGCVSPVASDGSSTSQRGSCETRNVMALLV